jgi:pSer/pThr/pTyr-binding forkhead associated (FHA) protein
MTEKTPVPSSKISADWFLHGALTRIGDTLDKLTGRRWTPSSSLATSELIERLKRLLDAEAREIPGKGLVVPHNLRLLVQWDKFSTDGEAGLEKLQNELLTAAADHINDNLYYTMSPVKLEVKQDYFVEGVKLSASFDNYAEAEHEAHLSVTVPSINLGGAVPPVLVAPEPAAFAFVARYVVNGQPRDRRFELSPGKRISVGRTSSNQLAIDDNSVSKIHASLVMDAEGNVSVADTGSTNGTFINGERIAYGKAVRVGSGDGVRFGSVDVVFDRLEPSAATESKAATDESETEAVKVDGFTFSSRSESVPIDSPTPLIDLAETLKVEQGEEHDAAKKD